MNNLMCAMAVMTGLAAVGQTNTITFTNGTSVVSNAEPVRVWNSKLIYRLPGGSGGTVKLSDLPADLQDRFGFDSDIAAEDQRKEKARLEQGRREALVAFANAAAVKARSDAMATLQAEKAMVWGRVIQRIGNNLLVDADMLSHSVERDQHTGRFRWLPTVENEMDYPGGVTNLASGIVLVTDFSKRKLVDGDAFAIVGFPIGLYRYTSVNNSEKTVRRYSADINRAVDYLLFGGERKAEQ